jgi:D-sedoheptulose 7-phosphate isomerase
MDFEKALVRVVESLHEGAELRVSIAKDLAPLIVQAGSMIVESLQARGKALFLGNGGSAAHAQHLAAEFVGRFIRDRGALAAVSLTTDSSILTAVSNDYGFEHVFARQIAAIGYPPDIVIGISTSGNSPNVIMAMKEARLRKLKTIGLTGNKGGELAGCVDLAINVAGKDAAQIQEGQIAIGHLLCELVEASLV